MYNLAKLLTDEPEKLERLGILFLKLLVTLFVGSVMFGFDISYQELIENPIPKDYSITKFIYFLISLVIIWYVLWTFIAELILAEIPIWLLSKIGNNKSVLEMALELFSVISISKGTVTPKKNVIQFSKALNSYNDEDEKFITESKTRIRQYYIISVVLYITLLCSPDICMTNAMKWVGGFMVLNFLVVSILINKAHKHISENLDELKNEYSRLAFTQMTFNALEKNSFIKRNYKIDKRTSRIFLERIHEFEWLPERFKLFLVYYWNEDLTKEIMKKELSQRSTKDFPDEAIGKRFDVVVSNISPTDDGTKQILKQKGFVYIHGTSEEEIFKAFEVMFFKVTDGHYTIN